MEMVSEWIPLVQSFIEKLKITSVDVIGCSAGAPYAYATALACPKIINHCEFHKVDSSTLSGGTSMHMASIAHSFHHIMHLYS